MKGHCKEESMERKQPPQTIEQGQEPSANSAVTHESAAPESGSLEHGVTPQNELHFPEGFVSGGGTQHLTRNDPAEGTALSASDETLNPRAGGLFVNELGMNEDRDLERLKAQWLFGQWDALAAVDLGALKSHPDRDRLALLVASAKEQVGKHDEARHFVRMAIEWGCNRRLIAQVLIAGVHNTLGRASAIAQHEKRIGNHFREAVAAGTNSEENRSLLGHARSVSEMARLGLLPQAAATVDKELAKTREIACRPERTQARIRVLETQMELLHHELSLAQQRGQLFLEHADGKSTHARSSEADPQRLSDLSQRSCSQLGQDLWVLEQTSYKKKGFFVEFGASDGVLLSNTYLLESEFDWQGICAEPNPKFFRQLKTNRRCMIAAACIAGVTGRTVDFLLADEYGGMSQYAEVDMNAARRQAYAVNGDRMTLTTVSLHDFLVKHNAPRDIDYLSIDTEGSELEILAAFPFEQWRISLLTVEHNFTPAREQIRALLCGHGYQCIEREWDDWFVNPDMLPHGALTENLQEN